MNYRDEFAAEIKLAGIRDDLNTDVERERVLGGQSVKILLDNTLSTVRKIGTNMETQARATQVMAESMSRMATTMQSLLEEYQAVRKQNDELLSLLNYKVTVGSASDSGGSVIAGSSKGTPGKTEYFMCGSQIRNKYDAVACFLTRIVTIVREAEGPEGTKTIPENTVFSTDYDELRRVMPEFVRADVKQGPAKLISGPITIPEISSKPVIGILRVIADSGPGSRTIVQAVDLHELCQNASYTQFIKTCLTIASRFLLVRGVVCPGTVAILSAVGEYPTFTTSPQAKLCVDKKVIAGIKPVNQVDTTIRELKHQAKNRFIADCCGIGSGQAMARLRQGEYKSESTPKARVKG